MKIDLTDEEIVLLDGKVSESAQVEVWAAKARLAAVIRYPKLSVPRAKFIADVVTEACTVKLLAFRVESIRYCRLCERKEGFYTRTRNSRNGRRGTPDYSKPKTFQGVELHDSFVSIQNHVSLGCCWECFLAVKPYLAEALRDVKAQIPKAITGHEAIYERTKKMRCKHCEWIGLESEMGMLPAMIQGQYRGKCPSCGAENQLFSHPVIPVEPLEFEVVQRAA